MSISACLFALVLAQPAGYYRQPAISGDTIVFVSEGDLWKVPAAGGVASRLTTHPSEESSPAISPDGKSLAFVGRYEGPAEVYIMPMSGGLPKRLTFDGGGLSAAWGWTGDGKVIIATDKASTLPNQQLFLINPETGERSAVPLAQASDGSFDEAGVLYFTRLAFQGSQTKRYKGGTAQNIWRFDGKSEATPLTGDYDGTSKRPMWWQGKVYFATDRDGVMNLWSMGPDGKGLKQLTRHEGLDVQSPSMDKGKIAYQIGADIHVLDVAGGGDTRVPITLASDLDQEREHWVKPMEYLTSAHLSADGDRVVLTARGQVFVAPHRQGRFVEAGRVPGVRYRDARFMPDGKSLIVLGDESGEVEAWRLAANGVGGAGGREQLTTGATVLRWEAVVSPDGKLFAHHDKDQRLFIHDIEKKTDTLVEQSMIDTFAGLTWSKDSKWLAYVDQAPNLLSRIKIYSVETGKITPVTSDRYDSSSPAWSPDGKWLYFLSERHLASVVGSPWGSLAPDPFLDKKTKVYAVALKAGQRSPFVPRDEVNDAKEKAEKERKDKEKREKDKEKHADDQPGDRKDEAKKDDGKKDEAKKDEPKKDDKKIEIDLDGIQSRLIEVPVANGNYGHLTVTDKALFFLSGGAGGDRGKQALVSFPITSEAPELKVVVDADVASYEQSADGKKFLVRKADAFWIIDANPGKADLEKKDVSLAGWRLSVIPREEWRQMYTESWRLLRDYFYDPNMHGVDWKAMHAKYLPLVGRVRSREELANVMAQLTGELSALHHFVRPGDIRTGDDDVAVASLGCVLTLDNAKGGLVISRIYRNDPDEPGRAAPIARPGVEAGEGDVIEAIDGASALEHDAGSLLRGKAGKQVLLRIKPAAGGDARDAIAVPFSGGAESDLRYHEWEYTRRKLVDEWSHGQIGYVHLRAMGTDNYTEFAKGFFPDFNKKGLLIDVRHNRGGNIDSWLLSKLSRKAWFFWSQRVGMSPTWNMQFAFRGHMACLINERSASDGEAFPEGFRRLGLGKLIGTRTWGGEIWLSSSNVLVDKGIATAAENGVWGPEGQWLIEGRGVEPDIMVDNLPFATFKGDDAQLKAGVDHLLKLIQEQPIPEQVMPKFPDKSFKPK